MTDMLKRLFAGRSGIPPERLACADSPREPIVELAPPERLAVPVSGFHARVDANQTVAKGDLLAAPVCAGHGGVHAPMAAVVEKLDLRAVHLRVVRAAPETAAPKDLNATADDALPRALVRLGLDVSGLGPAQTLVVNGLNPEPGVGVAEALLSQRRQTLEQGLDLVRRLVRPQRTVLAVRQGADYELAGCEPVHRPAEYPRTLDPMVRAATTGCEDPAAKGGAVVLGALELWGFGRVAETGLPLTETVLSVNGRTLQVAIGTPLEAVFAAAGIPAPAAGAGDRVVLGGPFRGQAARALAQGMDKNVYGLLVVPHGTYLPVEDAPCMECGACVRICPSRVDPCLLSGLAEFRHWERAEQHHVQACMECGLCGYVCPSRRPVLQYIRLAKAELELLKPKAEHGDLAAQAELREVWELAPTEPDAHQKA